MARVVGGPSYDWLSSGLSSLARGVAGGMNAATQQQHAVELDELQRRRQLQDVETQRGFQQEDWRRDRAAHLSDLRAANAMDFARAGIFAGDGGLDREHFAEGALGGAPRAPQVAPPAFPRAQQGPASPHLGPEWVNRAASLFTAPPDAPTPDLQTPASAQPNALARLAHSVALRNTAELAARASPLAFDYNTHPAADGVGPVLPYEEAVARGRAGQDVAALDRARTLAPGNVRPEEVAPFFQRGAPPEPPKPVNPLDDLMKQAKIAELDARRRLQGKRGDYIGADLGLRRSDLAMRYTLGMGKLDLQALGLGRTFAEGAPFPDSPEGGRYRAALDKYRDVNINGQVIDLSTPTGQETIRQQHPDLPRPLVLGGDSGGQSTRIRIGQGAPAPGQTQAPLPQQLGDAMAQAAAAQRMSALQRERAKATPQRQQEIDDAFLGTLPDDMSDEDAARALRAFRGGR